MNDQIFQTPLNKHSYAADFRARARAALSGRWPIAVGVFIIAAILGGIGSGVNVNFNFNFNKPSDETIREFAEILRGSVTDAAKFLLESAWFAVALTAIVIAAVFSAALHFFVGSPVAVGYARFNLDLIDGDQKAGLHSLFDTFRTCYGKSLGVRLLVSLITLAVGICAAVAPIGFLGLFLFTDALGNMGVLTTVLLGLLCFAIYAAGMVVLTVVELQYSLCTYILAEYPELGVIDVLRNSRTLMKGNKWRLFCLNLSFIGWILLASFCSCGLGMLVVSPYMNAAVAAFYDEVSQRSTAKEVEFPSVNPEDYFPQ